MSRTDCGINFHRSESFTPRVVPIRKGFTVQGSKTEVTNIVSLCKNGGKHGGTVSFTLRHI